MQHVFAPRQTRYMKHQSHLHAPFRTLDGKYWGWISPVRPPVEDVSGVQERKRDGRGRRDGERAQVTFIQCFVWDIFCGRDVRGVGGCTNGRRRAIGGTGTAKHALRRAQDTPKHTDRSRDYV